MCPLISAVYCKEENVPTFPIGTARTTNDYLVRKAEDNDEWNAYQRELLFKCPEGHVLELPKKLDEQDFNQTEFVVRCDADARWRPALNHTVIPDLPVIPACIRELTFKIFN